MLKETKYTEPPPQQRTHPPIENIPMDVVPMTSTPSPSYPEERKKIKIAESPIRPSTSQNEGNAWLPYEQESSSFWKSNEFPKPVRVKKKTNGSLIDCLKNDKPVEPLPAAPQAPKLRLDKHSPGCENENPTFILLKQIYPNQSPDHLWDLFEKCNGDLDWTVDVLLSDNSDVDNRMVNGSGFQCMCNSKVVMQSPKVSDTSFNTSCNKLLDAKPQRVKKDVAVLKKTIENQFVLGEEFYSEKLKKLKNKRYGIEEQQEDKNDEKAIPVDFNYNDLPDFDSESNSNETESNEMIEMDLGTDLIAQLTQMFETENDIILSQGMPSPKLNSNVFMPKSLAKQLYVIWMESLYNQMEENKQKSLREDEEFARILELPKYANRKAVPSNYTEIMDMELAWQLYYAENGAQPKDTSPKDLADHLTRMKLCELFPKVDKKTLVEVLMAHNNSFAETVEVLKLSVNVNGLDEKMNITKKELLDKVKHENEKLRNTVPASPKIIVKDDRQNMAEEVQRQALRIFEENRNLASHHSQMRAECFQKAKEAHQKSNPGVALYYSQIANLHKSRSEDFNHRAANSIMEVHDIRQNNPDYIDLHYLHTAEAAQCLDIFLDGHISKLKNSTRSYKYVFIITGRGLHSAGGVSTIKVKVKQRLKERKLV